MNNLYLTYVTDDDWAALYFNGRCDAVEQNHSLRMDDVLESLIGWRIVSVESLEVDSEEGMASWLGGRGFPEYLSDIPESARV